MYILNYDITIGDYRLQTVETVNITSSILNLADTANIHIACPVNRKSDITGKIKVGDQVQIRLGYNKLEVEFSGYLKSIYTQDEGVTLECMDALYLLNKSIKNTEYKDVTLKSLLEDVMKQVDPSYKVESTYELTFEKFTAMRTTALDVVKKVQETTKANIYFKGTTLYVQQPYADTTGRTAIYNTAVNIEASDLKYVTKEDRKIEIEVTYTGKDGKKTTKTIGQTGGEKKTITATSENEADMIKQAESEYNLWNYDGFEGGFTGWLVPFCEAGDTVVLRDADMGEGKYYCTGTEVEFGSNGGKRTIKLGRRLG
jgi:hypothetical protein